MAAGFDVFDGVLGWVVSDIASCGNCWIFRLTVTRVSQPPATAPAAMLTAVDGLLMLYVFGPAGCKVDLHLAVLS